MLKVKSKFNTNLIYIIVLGFSLRIFQLLTTDNFFWGGDNLARIQIGETLLYSFKLFPNLDWLPLHFHLLFSNFLILPDKIFSPRLVNVIISTLTIIPIYGITKIYFKNEYQSLLASLLYACSFPIIFLSTMTHAEALNSLLVMIGIYYFLKYIFSHSVSQRKLIAISGIFFGLANLTKYESWIISFFCGMYLILIKKNFKDIALYAFLTALPILWVFYEQFIISNDFFRGINYSDHEVQKYFQKVSVPLTKRLDRVLLMFPFHSLILTLPFIFYGTKKNKQNFLEVLILFLIIVFFYKLFISDTLLPEFRYFYIHSIIIFILFSNKIYLLYTKTNKTFVNVSFILITLQSSFYTYYNFQRHSGGNLQIFDEGFKKSAEYYSNLKLLEDEKGRIFVDKDDTWSVHIWHIYANIKRFNSLGCSFRDRFWVEDTTNNSSFMKCFISKKIKYFVFFKNGKIQKLLSRNKFFMKNYQLIEMFSYDNYKVLKVQIKS